MNGLWNIGMQGGFGSGSMRTGGWSLGRRRWPERESDLGHDVRPEQIQPERAQPETPERPSVDREKPQRRSPPPEVSP